MTAAKFLLALACDAPREVLERTWADSGAGFDTLGAAAGRMGLTAALGRFAGSRRVQVDGKPELEGRSGSEKPRCLEKAAVYAGVPGLQGECAVPAERRDATRI